MSQTIAEPRTQTLDTELIVPFVNSVRSLFKTMVNMEMTVERPYVKTDGTTSYDVSGIIGFSGQIQGSVIVSFAVAAAKKIVATFAGMEMEPGTPDFADAVGELANMIAGAAKKSLGSSANITVPTVILGQSHGVARLRDVPCVVIPCTTPAGNFALEVSIKRVRN